MAVRINQESFEAEVLKAEIPVLADFYSDSCVPCKRLSPLLAEVEEENADSLKVVKININFDTGLAEQYEVQAAPTLILFKNGEEVDRLRGSVKKAEIIELIKK
ncbi:MAG: thioredoxin fold domain-containing protein [Clostridia bacterium]|nr:thioredoxin fold domain-containing protein [Clostridia bacterium]